MTMLPPSFNEQLAYALINGAYDPILVFNADWHILAANPPAEAMLGMSIEALFGKPYQETPRGVVIQTILDACKMDSAWHSEDGKVYKPQIRAVGDHDPVGWVTILRDITQIDKLNRSQNEFIRVVSHDLRSPLTSIQGFASMLSAAGTLTERQTHYVEKVLSGITQMTALVENIQDAGRFDPETGFYEMARTACDISALVQRVVNNHLMPAEKQELTISVEIEEPLPIIFADNLMLERALTNLIDNAIKYTPNGGTICVRAGVNNHAVVIGVQDNGYGISEEDQKLLFQRHVRLVRKEHHRKAKGSGLGLFIVRSVAQRHQGNAWVVSKEGEGSTFYLSIPLTDGNQ